jgi:malate dehydrogenase (quinone)
MLDVLEKCFPEQMQSAPWKEKLQQMIPLYHASISDSAWLQHRAENNHILHLDD